MGKFSVVVDGDEIVNGLNRGHAEGIAAGIREEQPDAQVSVVPYDPDDPNDGPAALKALFPF
jgi:hypothetical protein